MFDHHRKSPWFAEKYDPSPEFVSLRHRVRKEGWNDELDTFLHDLEAGKFDPDLNEPEPESAVTKEISSVQGECMAPEETKNAADDEMQFNVDAEEDGGDHEASRVEINGRGGPDNRRSNRGEEISVPPEGNQVMIRTIPPDIGRLKLEEVRLCFVICNLLNMLRRLVAKSQVLYI